MNNFKLSLFLIFMSFNLFAGGKLIGNGGDSRALEFTKFANQAILDIEKYPEIFKEINSHDIQKVFDGAEILISDIPVYSEKNGVKQFSTAINYKDPDTIVIYGARWDSIKTNEIKKALVLHELLGLLGKETTGDYSITKLYLNKLGIYCSSGLCEDIPRYNCLLSKTDSSFKPKILMQQTLGNNGSDSYLINLYTTDMKVDINMNTNANGFIIIVMNYKDRTVAYTELHGTNFPDVVISHWKDTTTSMMWDVKCSR